MLFNVLNNENSSMFHPGNFKISIWKLTFISLLLVISFPIKSVSLLFLILYNFYFILQVICKKIMINKLIIVYFLFLFLFQCVLVSYLYSPLFIYNVFLFFIFISPILWFIATKEWRSAKNLSYQEIKEVIETYLKIQIFFSFINMIYRIAIRGFSFDTDFGDIVAGTFRMPFTYKADVSNPIFALSMSLILIYYIVVYKKRVNKLLILLSFLIIFLASVNHLILALLLSGVIAYFNRYFFRILIIGIVVYFLYSLFQPGNFLMIGERVQKIFQVFTNLDFLNKIGYKGQYLYKWIQDFTDNKLFFIFTGVGAGTYSSRAAMFFSGDYIQGFPFENMSDFMKHNTFYLWKKYLAAPAWMQGSFNYPFNSLFTLIAELGAVNVLVISVLFWKTLKGIKIYNVSHRIFIIVLLFLLGFVDNYYEYYQVFFIFYLLHFILLKSNYKVLSDESISST